MSARNSLLFGAALAAATAAVAVDHYNHPLPEAVDPAEGEDRTGAVDAHRGRQIAAGDPPEDRGRDPRPQCALPRERGIDQVEWRPRAHPRPL
jgi:hypothetical protein